jgi:adenine C2-methylase RlmN of 23S rRNA A2503 and tRNA A37
MIITTKDEMKTCFCHEINCERFPIAELIDSCRYYVEKTNRRITFEWALIRNQTDTPLVAQQLGFQYLLFFYF